MLLVAALALLPACAGLLHPRRGSEKARVVVLEVRGHGAAKLRDTVVTMLQDDGYELIPRKRYDATAKKLHARRLRKSHVAKVAAELELDAVIYGRVKGRGHHRYLELSVREGKTGKRVDRFRIRLTRRRHLTKKGNAQLEDKLVASLDAVAPKPEPEPEEPPIVDEPDSKTEVAGDHGKSEKAGARTAANDEKKPSKKDGKADAEKDEPPPIEMPEVGDDGQAMDDEMPAVLEK